MLVAVLLVVAGSVALGVVGSVVCVVAALAVVLPWGVGVWRERRAERQLLADAHGLSRHDAALVVGLVESEEWLRPSLHPAARDYARRRLSRRPVPVHTLVMGTMGVVFGSLAVLTGALVAAVLGPLWLLQAVLAYRSNRRAPDRIRRSLDRLDTSPAPGG